MKSSLHTKKKLESAGRPTSLNSLLRLLDDRSTENYISSSKNEPMNDATLIMQCKNDDVQ